MTVHPQPLSDADLSTLAVWHQQALPSSVLSWLGTAYLRSFYKYVQASDLDALVVHRDVGGELAAVATIARQPDQLLRRLLLRTPMIFFLILRAPYVAAGLVRQRRARSVANTVSETAVDAPLSPEIVHFYTAPERRGQGLGTALLQQCEAFLREQNEFRYWVKTEGMPENPAIGFYRSQGLEPIGTLFHSGRRFAVLEKQLGPSR